MLKSFSFGKQRYLVPAAVLACMALALTAQAEISGPCAETVNKYCKDVVPGSGRIMKCLNDHRDDQSIACKDWLEEQNKSLNELNTACPEEIARLCNFDPPDRLRIVRCLDDNYVNIKMDCREKLREIKGRLKWTEPSRP